VHGSQIVGICVYFIYCASGTYLSDKNTT